MKNLGPGEMAYWIWAFTTLAENLGLILSIHIEWLTTISYSMVPNIVLWLPHIHQNKCDIRVHMCVYRIIIKNNSEKNPEKWCVLFHNWSEFILGANCSSNQSKNGTTFPRACPKCNIHFNLLDPLKNHMTVNFF